MIKVDASRPIERLAGTNYGICRQIINRDVRDSASATDAVRCVMKK